MWRGKGKGNFTIKLLFFLQFVAVSKVTEKPVFFFLLNLEELKQKLNHDANMDFGSKLICVHYCSSVTAVLVP